MGRLDGMKGANGGSYRNTDNPRKQESNEAVHANGVDVRYPDGK